MPIITLTTDFGSSDTFVGVMKGVILSIAPSATIVDLTHGVPPQDILAGALALEESVEYFPPGTIHVAVIDPGVGSPRAGIILETDRAIYVGPANGLFDLVVKKERFKRAVSLDNPKYRLAAVSSTFHGRDIFAPAAAHFFNGIPLNEFGPAWDVLPILKIPSPCNHGEFLQIHILKIDHFGNMITDLTPALYSGWNPGNAPMTFEFLHSTFTGAVSATYSEVPDGSPVAYFGSSRRLEIGIANGNAAGFFKAARGFSIRLVKR